MKKRIVFLSAILAASLCLAGCAGGNEPVKEAVKEAVLEEAEVEVELDEGLEETLEEVVSEYYDAKIDLPDGEYQSKFDTDSSMFHVNEAFDGYGTLTVKDGKATLHISMPSKNIVNLYPGLAKDAQRPGAKLLEPTLDEVTYSDGYTETVHGFDVPVPCLDEEFDLALIGTKGIWYDHKVVVSSPEDVEGTAIASAITLEDGSYSCEVELSGGTGRATIDSPCDITVEDGEVFAQIIWSSDAYDYMIVDGEKILPDTLEGGSHFTIPVEVFDSPITVIADTTAMSTPHEIEYELFFYGDTIQ